MRIFNKNHILRHVFNGNLCACLCVGSGYKVSMLASLSEGETLMIGGKEVEVMGVISAEDFAKGRCFQDVHIENEEPHTKSGQPFSRRLASKPFCPPTLFGRAEHPGSKPEVSQPADPATIPWLQVCGLNQKRYLFEWI